MDQLQDLIPTDKGDLERARAAVEAGYPAVEPILDRLIECLQDYNWPVAHVLTPFLESIGTPLVPHIWHVLRTDDQIWKYWVIGILIPSLPEGAAVEFRPDSNGSPTTRSRTSEGKNSMSGLETCSNTLAGADVVPNPSLQRTITSVASLPRLLAAE